MGVLIRDLRFALRGMKRNPLFTATVIAILAVGIGANTAIFGVVNSVVLQGLPFDEPETLVLVDETYQPAGEALERRAVSYPNYRDWQGSATSFDDLAIIDRQNLTLSEETGAPLRVRVEFVSPEYFAVLRAAPTLGRLFDADDDRIGSPVAIVSYDLWRSRLGSDAGVVGMAVVLNGVSVPVVGVAARAFGGAFGRTDVWVPFRAEGALVASRPADRILEGRGVRGFTSIGRLQQGVSLQDAQGEMDVIAARLQGDHPRLQRDRAVIVLPLEDQILGSAQQSAVLLLGAVGLVLLITCANVASLLLVRQVGRTREIALRLSLGASRGGVLRQLLTESIVLGLAGGALGSVLAVSFTDLLVSANLNDLPAYVHPGTDLGALGFALAVSLATGILFGALPAISATRVAMSETLKSGSRSVTAGGGPLNARRLLVVSQIAVALVLLIGAGLMIKSLTKQLAIDPGLRSDGVVTMQLDLPPSRYDREDAGVFSRTLRERLIALPGVAAVTVSSDIPLASGYSAMGVTIDDRPETADARVRVYSHGVTPGYFNTLGIPLLRGREFADSDVPDSPPVVIVNQYMAERYWPGGNPVGKTVSGVEIVGVAADVKFRGLVPDPVQNPDEPDIYYPLYQRPLYDLSVVIRAAIEPAQLVERVRAALRSLDPALPLYNVATMDEIIQRQTARSRAASSQLGFFALIALLLATTGVYGVVAYSVRQRTNEIGVRIALGADRGTVVAMVLRQGLTLVGVGLALGLVIAVAGGRLIASQLYDVASVDPATYAAVIAVFGAVGVAASAIPAWRATRVDPVAALRYE